MRHSTWTAPALEARVLLCMAAVIWVPAAWAHHSGAMYDDKKVITIEGTVARYEWANPHVYLYVQQLTDSGQTVQWEIEASPPSILRRLGWSQDTLAVGDKISVTGNPAKDPSWKKLHMTLIRRGDTTLFDRSVEVAQLASVDAQPSAPPADSGLNGVWVTLLAPKIEEQLDPDNLSLTPKGKAAAKHFNEDKMHPGANCVPNPAPVLMITPDLKRITAGEGVILIDGEFDGAQRTIHMDVSTHELAPTSVQGHSIGHWEGKTLVIDTTRFADYALGDGYGVPSGPRKHLVERLTPAADGASLTYHFEMSDPEFLAAPIAGEVQWVFRPNTTYAPLKCDLNNARRFTTH